MAHYGQLTVTASSTGAGQFSVDAVRRENRGRGGRWLGSEPQQSHNAKRSANYQSHNAKCTARDQGAAPGDEAVTVMFASNDYQPLLFSPKSVEILRIRYGLNFPFV